MKKHAIIVAGGKGLRMGTELPKQFLPINGRPVLMHTIDAFLAYDPQISITLALPHEQQELWQELCHRHDRHYPITVVDGGDTRFDSVRRALATVGNEGLVAVHDGVRPFVSPEVIGRCFDEAAHTGAVVPVVDVVDTVRRLTPEGSHTVDRSLYKLVQTPQVFAADLLQRAYRQPYSTAFTDDASVVEALGKAVHLVPGNRENIKITTPFDLQVASVLAQ